MVETDAQVHAVVQAHAKSLHVADLNQQSDALSRSATEWRTKWFLSLAVANGALAVGVSARLPDAKLDLPMWGILLPALWAAGIGVIISGAIPWLWTRRVEHHGNALWARAGEIAALGDSSELARDSKEGYAAFAQIYRRGLLFWNRATSVAEGLAASTFVFGVIWILARLTFG